MVVCNFHKAIVFILIPLFTQLLRIIKIKILSRQLAYTETMGRCRVAFYKLAIMRADKFRFSFVIALVI